MVRLRVLVICFIDYVILVHFFGLRLGWFDFWYNWSDSNTYEYMQSVRAILLTCVILFHILPPMLFKRYLGEKYRWWTVLLSILLLLVWVVLYFATALLLGASILNLLFFLVHVVLCVLLVGSKKVLYVFLWVVCMFAISFWITRLSFPSCDYWFEGKWWYSYACSCFWLKKERWLASWWSQCMWKRTVCYTGEGSTAEELRIPDNETACDSLDEKYNDN